MKRDREIEGRVFFPFPVVVVVEMRYAVVCDKDGLNPLRLASVFHKTIYQIWWIYEVIVY